MEHRRFLAQPRAQRPFAGSELFARIGGRAAVARLIAGLYDRIESDAALRPLFERDLGPEREAQQRFFGEWLGGPAEYSERAHLPLQHRHDMLPLTPALAGKWLAHFQAALAPAVPDAADRDAIYAQVHALAQALVNEHDVPSALRTRPHGSCLRYAPASESLALARRGDADGLRALLERAPDVLVSVPHAAQLLHLAALAGREAVIELLLERGVDVDKPAPIAELIFVTALCAARSRRRRGVEARLLQHGAREDIFSHAFLGDLTRLQAALASDRAAAQALDPAVDALQITPLHHAVAGGREAALSLLLQAAEPPLLNGARALRDAVARESVVMVRALLERGVNPSSLGAGRWVLHPDLAPLLAGAGAAVDRSGAWIGLACTGNQGRKDDPELVAALLRHGARADDRRLVGQGNDGGRATALHYAAKAGFLRTLALLLEHGADPGMRDDNGLTPLDWLARAASSVDRAAVRRLLERGRRS